MSCHTVTESAKLADVSRRTIQRYIRSGKLSARIDEHGNPKVDTSELLRVFPNLSHPPEKILSQSVAPIVTPPNIEQLLQEIKQELLKEIQSLRDEVKELKRIEYKPETAPEQKQVITAKMDNPDLDYIPSFSDFLSH